MRTPPEQIPALIEDCEWLIETGVHPAWWHIRLGRTQGSLMQVLRRAGRDDLVRHLYAENQRQVRAS